MKNQKKKLLKEVEFVYLPARFDFRGPNLFWQRSVDFIMSSPNADLIAVSLACPKDVKSPYIMYRASYSLQLSSSL